MPIVISTFAAGAPLPKIFRPFILKPPSTLVSVPEPASQSEPPLVARIRRSAAIRRSIGSGPLLPPRQAYAMNATGCVCIDAASAVELQ